MSVQSDSRDDDDDDDNDGGDDCSKKIRELLFFILPSVLAIVLHSRQEDGDEVEATEKINKRFADFPNPIALLLISLCLGRYLQNLLNIVFIKTQSNKDGHKIC